MGSGLPRIIRIVVHLLGFFYIRSVEEGDLKEKKSSKLLFWIYFKKKLFFNFGQPWCYTVAGDGRTRWRKGKAAAADAINLPNCAKRCYFLSFFHTVREHYSVFSKAKEAHNEDSPSKVIEVGGGGVKTKLGKHAMQAVYRLGKVAGLYYSYKLILLHQQSSSSLLLLITIVILFTASNPPFSFR
jgi:hypothetical protein